MTNNDIVPKLWNLCDVLRDDDTMKDHFGCVGIIVDAKVDAITFYVKYGFIECEASGEIFA